MRTIVNPRLTDELLDRLVDIWVAATNAGGAVGFVGPVDAGTVAPAVAGFWDRVLDGVTDLVVVSVDERPAGFGFLTGAADPDVAPHRAEVQKVMRDPEIRGKGIGAAVLDGLEARARERDLTLLTLTVRGGTGTEAFYAGHGYVQVASLPGWLLIDGTPTSSLVMAKRLDDQTPPQDDTMTASVPLPVTRLDPDLPLPAYARPGDAGLDLMAREDAVLPAGTRRLMPTGLAVAIPEGHVGLVHPRSGLAIKKGLSVVNAPGTIDAGYRGEVMVPLINLDPSATIRIARGDRIAQLLLQRVERADLVEVDELPDGVRGDGGFGSTGT